MLKKIISRIAKKQQNGIKNKDWLLSTKDKFKSNYPSSQDIEEFLSYKSNKNIINCISEVATNLFNLFDKTFTETLKKIILADRISGQKYTQNIFISEYRK